MKILGGDIGGTNSRLAVFTYANGQLNLILQRVYPSKQASAFEEIMESFLLEFGATVDVCCLGVAGPVKEGRCVVTNLPWVLDEKYLSRRFAINSVILINDLVANAYGIELLSAEDLLTVSEGVKNERANRAVISAGTGLGEAGILWSGTQHLPFATEGGHCDFAPCTQLQIQLLQFLQTKLKHVSYEKILCGNGLGLIYDFLSHEQNAGESQQFLEQCDSQGKAATISANAVNGESRICVQALEMFFEIYGQEASNLALKTLAIGGIYLGGGIIAKLANKIQFSDAFLRGFNKKGEMSGLLADIPVSVIRNSDTALMGAALLCSRSIAPHD